HVYGYRPDLGQFLRGELAVVLLQTLLATALDYVFHRASLRVTDYRLVAMPFGKRFLIDTQVGRDATPLPRQASGHRLFHNTPSLVPTGPRQARHPRHVTFLQGVNEPAFHPQAK